MFALVVRFDLHDQAAAAQFDALTGELAQHIASKEPGTLVYATHTVEDAPLARLFYEVYVDRAAFNSHNQTEHVRGPHLFVDARCTVATDNN